MISFAKVYIWNVRIVGIGCDRDWTWRPAPLWIAVSISVRTWVLKEDESEYVLSLSKAKLIMTMTFGLVLATRSFAEGRNRSVPLQLGSASRPTIVLGSKLSSLGAVGQLRSVGARGRRRRLHTSSALDFRCYWVVGTSSFKDSAVRGRGARRWCSKRHSIYAVQLPHVLVKDDEGCSTILRQRGP